MAILAGVEEAGRGPIIGPMVMCICTIEESEEFELKALGVKDSKLLTPEQRERLFLLIKSMTKSKIVIIPPKEIDAAVESKTMNLNWLEAKTTAKLIASLKPDKAILDCPSNNIKAYTDYVRKGLPEKQKKMEIISEHKADVNHPIVSAASILAKVTRDKEIEKIQKTYKVEFGSGYPSDPRTIAFVKENWNLYPFFRKSWETYKKVAMEKTQKKLGEF
ncbi:MAG: ribonuclease HII [Nanoarchaeota archaeon]